MKVLMFGWEFPPHISGGLGTACAGLTRALEKAEVDILFVIPKLHGGESADRTTFINASFIPVRQKKYIINDELVSATLAPGNPAPGSEKKNVNTTKEGRLTTFEVPALLTPYQIPSPMPTFGLENWSYSFESGADPSLPAERRPHVHKGGNHPRMRVRYVKEPYQFSGSYGQSLLDEVGKYAEAAAEIAKRNHFNVIHAHDWMTYPAGIIAKKKTGKPLIVHVHATEIDRSGAHMNSTVFRIEREAMQFADKVVTVSNWTKNIAIKHYDVREEKIEVVHNGITPKSGQETTASVVPPLNCPIVTFLGRITHQKGPMYFVEAARRVHEKFPDAHFVVAGSGDQLPNMIERIAQVRMSEYFHFTGFLRGDDIDRMWAMSNVYVMPSVSEPFGIAPLEAIQAGVPVILSKQAGVSEVMPHAIKVDFWNSEALAEAISNVLRFKSLAETLKKNGAEHIKDITWDKAAKKLTALYDELTTNDGKPKKSGLLLSSPPTEKTADAAVL
jgi:glycogen(starch) synthase